MKIKNSIRKKVLTSLLIGATLGTTMTGMGASKSFADSNNEKKCGDIKYNSVAPKELSEKILKGIEEDYNRARTLQVGPNSKYYGTYRDSDGDLVVLVRYQGKFFAADQLRNVLTGPLRIGNHLMYFGSDGAGVKNQWVTIGNEPTGRNGKYYFTDNYVSLRGGEYYLRGNHFLFDDYGKNLTGFQQVGQEAYYYNPDTGVKHLGGWLNHGGNIRCLDSEKRGVMVRGWMSTMNGWMYFYPQSGVMAVSGVVNATKGNSIHKPGLYVFVAQNGHTYKRDGFYTENGNRYYFNPSDNGRALQNEWLSTSARASNITGSMYFDQNGHMAKGVKTIDGETYVFVQPNSKDWNYYQGLGWYTDKSTNKRYFFNDGRSARSATNFRDTTPVGAAVKGTQIINGKTYEFDQNGVLIK